MVVLLKFIVNVVYYYSLFVIVRLSILLYKFDIGIESLETTSFDITDFIRGL